MELVVSMYNVHPYFSLKNVGKTVCIIHGKIWHITWPQDTARALLLLGSDYIFYTVTSIARTKNSAFQKMFLSLCLLNGTALFKKWVDRACISPRVNFHVFSLEALSTQQLPANVKRDFFPGLQIACPLFPSSFVRPALFPFFPCPEF